MDVTANMKYITIAIVCVCTLSMFCGEVKATNQTLSRCDDVKIPVDTTCHSVFSIRSKVLAMVDHDGHVETEEPFHYNKKEQVMRIKTYENFALHMICDKGDYVKEEKVEYQLIPCQKSAPVAVAVPPAYLQFVRAAPSTGEVTFLSWTQECCGNLTVPIFPKCDNEFKRDQMELARITDTEATEGLTKTLDCGNVTHLIICDNDGLSEKRIHIHSIPCSF